MTSSSSSLDSSPFLSTSSNDDSGSENPRPLAPVPLPTPYLPQWVYSTREATGDLDGDPSNQFQQCSHF